MRWRFVDPGNRAELAARNEVVSKIDSWWRAFQDKTGQIAALFSKKLKSKWDLPAWMVENLQEIHPQLMWEFGPAVRGAGHRLVITPESDYFLRPLVQAILKRSPILDDWEFYGYRLAEDLESTGHAVKGRTGWDIADFTVCVTQSERQLVDLEYASPSIASVDDSSALHAAFVATESLLGEQSLNNWIGGIGITPATDVERLESPNLGNTKRSPRFLGLHRLNETVNALIGGMRDQLPSLPHCEWDETAQWSLLKLTPEQADDYAAQHDLFVARSANLAQWKAAHSRGRFCSERFSRCGEVFCYLKLDGSEGLAENGFADKSEIEDALDAVLKPEKLGCCIGGGTGLRYSYIDLALTDVDRGIHQARQRLQAGKVPKRSWIQFFDSDWAAEWVGLYDDTPAPLLELNA